MFAMSNFITNTEHSKASRLLFQRLMVHTHHTLVHLQHDFRSPPSDPHVPDVSTLQGTMDLFAMCVCAELGELLDPAAYIKQCRAIGDIQHDQIYDIYTRGLARDILRVWRRQLIFSTGNVRFDGRTMYRRFFAHQVATLVALKRLAEKKRIHTKDPACTAAAFNSFVHRYFPFLAWMTPTLPGIADTHGLSLDNFKWDLPEYIITTNEPEKPVAPPKPVTKPQAVAIPNPVATPKSCESSTFSLHLLFVLTKWAI